ncbi:hypothetical protein KIW84_012809 [Lathyrus oleraceus]|uniref:Uncharacterized protein n=1 Tax=Pisum sativum TaxID=3888 RepID=A0A9D5BIW7_PEA|nr:hypothetical protein KIW84_012809 [Pisum sativum]
MMSFEDRALIVKANALPAHGNSSVNMVDGCPGEFKVFYVRFIRRSLVQMHKDICLVSDCEHDHDGCVVCSVNSRVGPIPYSSDKAVPYQYNATMIKDGQKVVLPATSSIVSIVDVTKVTRSGRVFGSVFPKDKEESVVSKKVEVSAVDPVSASKGKSGESSNLKANDDEEVLRLIKRNEFNMVEQLL